MKKLFSMFAVALSLLLCQAADWGTISVATKQSLEIPAQQGSLMGWNGAISTVNESLYDEYVFDLTGSPSWIAHFYAGTGSLVIGSDSDCAGKKYSFMARYGYGEDFRWYVDCADNTTGKDRSYTFTFTRKIFNYKSKTYYPTTFTFTGEIKQLAGSAAYTVAYEPGSYGTGSRQTATKTKGSALTLKGAIFTRSGYNQTGWAKTDGGAQVYALNASYTTDAALTLYPVWTYVKKTYTVTYKPGMYGSGTETSATKTEGAALTLKGVTFSRSGYTQVGWSKTDGGSQTYALNASYTSDAALVLYPVWSAKTYTVTYKPGANGKGSQTSSTKTHGVTLTLKGAIFTRTGYVQIGWATSDGGTKTYDLSAT